MLDLYVDTSENIVQESPVIMMTSDGSHASDDLQQPPTPGLDTGAFANPLQSITSGGSHPGDLQQQQPTASLNRSDFAANPPPQSTISGWSHPSGLQQQPPMDTSTPPLQCSLSQAQPPACPQSSPSSS